MEGADSFDGTFTFVCLAELSNLTEDFVRVDSSKKLKKVSPHESNNLFPPQGARGVTGHKVICQEMLMLSSSP